MNCFVRYATVLHLTPAHSGGAAANSCDLIIKKKKGDELANSDWNLFEQWQKLHSNLFEILSFLKFANRSLRKWKKNQTPSWKINKKASRQSVALRSTSATSTSAHLLFLIKAAPCLHQQLVWILKKKKGMAMWHGYAAYFQQPCTPFSKQTQHAFGLQFTVIDAYFIREFTVFLWLFDTLVLPPNKPLAPIIISTVLITDNKKTLTTLMYCSVHYNSLPAQVFWLDNDKLVLWLLLWPIWACHTCWMLFFKPLFPHFCTLA